MKPVGKWISGMALCLFLLIGMTLQAAETVEQLRMREKAQRERIIPPYSSPFLLTSIGQSPGASIARALFNVRAGLSVDLHPLADKDYLSHFKTLIMVVGASEKGMEALKVNPDKELARATALLDAATGAQVPIILMHLDGRDRRGGQSDLLLEEIIPYADRMVVKKEGNEDGFFTLKAEELGIPLIEIDKYSDLVDLAKKIFVQKQ